MAKKKVVEQIVYTLRSKEKSIHGKNIILPLIGETLVNKDGEIEVDEYVAKLLLNGDNWSIVQDEEEEAEDEQKSDKNLSEDDQDEEEEDDNEEEDDEDDTETEDEQKIKDHLETLTLEQMVDLAKESNLKGYNLFKSDEKKMRAFLLKKMTPEQK